METITLIIGSIGGERVRHEQREVQFVGEALWRIEKRRDENKGVNQTLYRVEDGRLIIYVEKWSKDHGESNINSVVSVTESDLGPNGEYWELGREAGFDRPLTLDEALGEKDSVSKDSSGIRHSPFDQSRNEHPR